MLNVVVLNPIFTQQRVEIVEKNPQLASESPERTQPPSGVIGPLAHFRQFLPGPPNEEASRKLEHTKLKLICELLGKLGWRKIKKLLKVTKSY